MTAQRQPAVIGGGRAVRHDRPGGRRRTSRTLTRRRAAIDWDLRTAWATGRRVALTLDAPAAEARVEGRVERVAATGAYVIVAGVHVLADVVLAVHWPSRLGDSTVAARPPTARGRTPALSRQRVLWDPAADAADGRQPPAR